MAEPEILIPATGSRIVRDGSEVVLFGQPPDIVKGLLRAGINRFDTLVLPDSREKAGVLLNNLEFPLYSFLFFSNGLAERRQLNLIGDTEALSQVMRLLRITLTGPTEGELSHWHTDPDLKKEWLESSAELALKNDRGAVIPVEDFFNLIPFEDDLAVAGSFAVERQGPDRYLVSNPGGDVMVDLSEDNEVEPPYPIAADYVPSGLSKFGVEVLGGASGFATNEPCTGLALCFNGDYVLIDSIPFLDQLLLARGISKNQVSAVFLTHLHDDHCALFPLMQMPHCVDLITTEEIFHMAMDKLACNLGWEPSVIAEHFNLIRVKPGDQISYYGLNIDVHNTIHSIPTIGATFSTTHKGIFKDVCIVGDNQNMSKIREMTKKGIVRQQTLDNLERLYTQRFHLLIADGGAGDIHGDPADALQSEAERVVFVHVEDVPENLKATFSVVSSGKRYTMLDGDDAIYTSQINHYLNVWLGKPVPNRWLRNLLAEHETYRYNTDDVILVQDTSARGSVYLILTGYCDVIRVDEHGRQLVATLQAGDILGEMAVLTGTGVRNASVIAKTPVTVCVFSEDTFRNFIRHSGLQPTLENRWLLRPVIKLLPQFSMLASTVADKIARVAEWQVLEAGKSLWIDRHQVVIFVEGDAHKVDAPDEKPLNTGDAFGWHPFEAAESVEIHAQTNCGLLRMDAEDYEALLETTPQLNYQIRKQFVASQDERPDWVLGEVDIR